MGEVLGEGQVEGELGRCSEVLFSQIRSKVIAETKENGGQGAETGLMLKESYTKESRRLYRTTQLRWERTHRVRGPQPGRHYLYQQSGKRRCERPQGLGQRRCVSSSTASSSSGTDS